jgi:Rv2175c C-terminal domain of unknown function/DNA-binding protein Rv2175c, wHTH domain
VSDVREQQSLEELVGEWLPLDAVADRLRVSATRVRQLVREHQLAAVAPTGSGPPAVPASFLAGDQVVKGLGGTLTLLADAGYDPAESIRWLFRPDDSLPGAPIVALRENRGTEVRRRAQALAF